METRKMLFSCILAFIALFCIYPSKTLAQDKSIKIDYLVTTTFENLQFNGSILVAENTKVIYKKGFGYSNMEWEIPNQPESKFRIGSMTKQFTAMLVMQLVEDGKIELDAKLTDYIPDYRKETGDRITIHHLLTHTSGIPRYTSLPGFKSDSIRIPYPQDYMVYHFLSGDLQFEPGTKFDYSNAYYLLAVIVEKVTGKSYLENLKERIFVPLGMVDSGIEVNDEIIEKLTSGYSKHLTGYRKAQYIYMLNGLGDGNMFSTVEDLFLWDQALYTEQLLSDKYKDVMFTSFLNNFAYGWKVFRLGLSEPSDSVDVIYHTGGLFGYSGIIVRFIEDKHSIIILLNNTGSFGLSVTNGLCREIANILYNRPYQIPKKSIAETVGKTILTHSAKEGIKHYHELKTKHHQDYKFEESELNTLGYKLLRTNKVEEAIEIFKLNVREYPEAYNTYDSLAEAYLISGQKELAITNYAKSFELNPKNTNAKNMITKLRNPE